MPEPTQRLRLHKVATVSSAPPTPDTSQHLRLHRITTTSTPAAPGLAQRLRLHKITTISTAAVTLTVTPDAVDVEPGSERTVTASMGSGTADSWAVRQVSGTPVQLTGDADSRTFVMPSVMPPSRAVVVLGFTAVRNGLPASAEVTATIEGPPRLSWTRVAGRPWVGATV
ncbi:hypothetical protein [Auraticoccus monumenti]|uniref:hypothetical protein n=1 Tax=Auraticoccus monumenti TaxID=675864 RepID=UPI0012F7EF26|nr:hypothetical protein [Auraticoccus monumenti]